MEKHVENNLMTVENKKKTVYIILEDNFKVLIQMCDLWENTWKLKLILILKNQSTHII